MLRIVERSVLTEADPVAVPAAEDQERLAVSPGAGAANVRSAAIAAM